MANPQDLAEQAFSLLQDALRESEARAADLDAQLQRRKAPKTKLEEQLDVLMHRLESVEAERTRWQQEAGHLEEMVEAERAKLAAVKKKLEIAESGPEKLTKKEINFWRAKAEDIDTETRDYKNRITALRKELLERDALIERLEVAAAQSPAAAASHTVAPAGAPPDAAEPSATEPAAVPPSAADTELEALRAQWSEREARLEELTAQLAELRERDARHAADRAAAVVYNGEIEGLRRQVAALETALTETHAARADAAAELAHTRAAAPERERQLREAQSSAERLHQLVAERDHRLVATTAELEQLRTEIAQNQQRERELRESGAHLTERIAELEQAIDAAQREERAQRESAGQLTERIAELEQALGAAQREERAQRVQAAEAAAERDDLRSRWQIAQTAADRFAAELDELGRRVDAQTRRIEGDARTLAERHEALVQRDQRIAELTLELERVRSVLHDHEQELAEVRAALFAANRDLDQVRQHNRRLESELSDAHTRLERFAAEKRTFSEQIAGLEGELKEEKEAVENLSEIANERREHLTKLTEQVEEANERYEEAKWRLGKAAHFERLVKRRQKLVQSLLAALRAKMKANVALKAGLDGLRVYKAAAEANQQKLLARIDSLKAELEEAEEAIARHQGATIAKEQLAASTARAEELEARLNTQADLIQSLEAELKTAKVVQKSHDEKSADHLRLQQQLAAKDTELGTKLELIVQLQSDLDEQQRRLAKLRGSESETLRLKTINDKDRSAIDALEREVAQLREALQRQPKTGAAGGDVDARLKERESTVAKLTGTIKDHEATIKKLNESLESWKRKYDFLATDAPDAYKTGSKN